LRQIHWRRNELPAYYEATAKTCELHLKAKNPDGAWQDYEDFLNSDGEKLPVSTWFELCRMLEERESYDRALSELEGLIQAYPTERQADGADGSRSRPVQSAPNLLMTGKYSSATITMSRGRESTSHSESVLSLRRPELRGAERRE
jgi:hypothetical protein